MAFPRRFPWRIPDKKLGKTSSQLPPKKKTKNLEIPEVKHGVSKPPEAGEICDDLSVNKNHSPISNTPRPRNSAGNDKQSHHWDGPKPFFESKNGGIIPNST